MTTLNEVYCEGRAWARVPSSGLQTLNLPKSQRKQQLGQHIKQLFELFRGLVCMRYKWLHVSCVLECA